MALIYHKRLEKQFFEKYCFRYGFFSRNQNLIFKRLAIRLHFARRLLAHEHYQDNSYWIRAGLDRPAPLEAPRRTRGRILRQIHRLLTRQKRCKAQSALQRDFRKLFVRGVVIKAPKISQQPLPEVIGKFQEMYNAAQSPSAVALILRRKALRDAEIGRRKSAPGVSGVTYGG